MTDDGPTRDAAGSTTKPTAGHREARPGQVAGAPPGRPAERYGRRAGRPGPGWLPALLVALVLLAGLGIALVAYRNLGGPGVSGTVTAFTTTADHVDITFVVQRDKPDRRAVCLARARSASGIEVGSAEVAVPAGSGRARITYRLATSTRAVTGEVTGCRYRTAG
ncbi:MAG TPA: DUF4307 domain-containing protein [Mycobacteriales bacterium]|nr:DUF4307 domain-containing protein [Mycobacteriales bacterium]